MADTHTSMSPLVARIHAQLCKKGVPSKRAKKMAVKAANKHRQARGNHATTMASEQDALEFTDFTDQQRGTLASKGEAMPGGSFPIRNKTDLAHAIRAWGRASDKAAAKAWILKRAKALGASPSVISRIQALGGGA